MKKFLSGSGILVPILYPIGMLAGLGAGGFLGGALTGSPEGTVAGALAGAGAGGALMLWMYAVTLGRRRTYPVIDRELRRSVLVERSSSFLFMSPAAWGVIATVMALVTAGAGGVYWYGGGPGGEMLHKSEKLLAGGMGDTTFGTPKEGSSLAMIFSTLVAGGLNPSASDQLHIDPPPGRQSIRVYCRLSTHGNVFIALAPDLKSYSRAEKWKLKMFAWAAAQIAAEHEEPAPERIAVAVRGRFFYDEIMIGKPVAGYLGGDGGIEERHRALGTRVLYPFFAAPTFSPELNVPPPSPSPASATPVAAAPAAPPPAPDPPSQAAPLAITLPAPATAPAPVSVPVPASAPAPIPAPAIVPMPAETVALGLPTPVCDWTSADGRTIRASLVRFTDASGAAAEFKREDGESFTIPMDKFSPADKAHLRRLFDTTKGNGS